MSQRGHPFNIRPAVASGGGFVRLSCPSSRTRARTHHTKAGSHGFNLETGVLQQNRHPRRPGGSAGVPRRDASRQSPRHADRVSNLAGAQPDRQRFPRHAQDSGGRRISAHRAVLPRRLCRLRFRRARRLQGSRAEENSRRRRRQLRELAFRHQGAAGQPARSDRLGQGRRPDADDGAQPRRSEEPNGGRRQASGRRGTTRSPSRPPRRVFNRGFTTRTSSSP